MNVIVRGNSNRDLMKLTSVFLMTRTEAQRAEKCPSYTVTLAQIVTICKQSRGVVLVVYDLFRDRPLQG